MTQNLEMKLKALAVLAREIAGYNTHDRRNAEIDTLKAIMNPSWRIVDSDVPLHIQLVANTLPDSRLSHTGVRRRLELFAALCDKEAVVLEHLRHNPNLERSEVAYLMWSNPGALVQQPKTEPAEQTPEYPPYINFSDSGEPPHYAPPNDHHWSWDYDINRWIAVPDTFPKPKYKENDPVHPITILLPENAIYIEGSASNKFAPMVPTHVTGVIDVVYPWGYGGYADQYYQANFGGYGVWTVREGLIEPYQPEDWPLTPRPTEPETVTLGDGTTATFGDTVSTIEKYLSIPAVHDVKLLRWADNHAYIIVEEKGAYTTQTLPMPLSNLQQWMPF